MRTQSLNDTLKTQPLIDTERKTGAKTADYLTLDSINGQFNKYSVT